MRKAYPFTFYFLYFAALACLAPFVVLFYQQLGFSGAQIGLLAGMAPLITLVSAPLWTGFADATRRHRLLMSLAIAGAVVVALVFPSLRTLGPVVVLLVLFSFFTAPISSFADSATMNMLAGQKDQYGRVRIGGTFGWGIFALVAGIAIQAFGLKLAFWGYAALMFLALLVCQRFVFSRAATGVSLRGGVRTLMANRRWVLFLALAFVGGVGFAAVNTYLFAYMQELNASKTTMGLALTFSTLAELPVLFYADRLLKRFKAHGLVRVGDGRHRHPSAALRGRQLPGRRVGLPNPQRLHLPGRVGRGGHIRRRKRAAGDERHGAGSLRRHGFRLRCGGRGPPGRAFA